MSAGESVIPLDTVQAIELAEGVEVRLRTAGPLLRGAALLLDYVIQGSALTVFGIIMAFTGVAIGGMSALGLSLLAWFFVSWWYPVLFEAGKHGATPGKRVLGLRVVQVSGSPITLSQAVLRNFLRYADAMPFLGAGLAGIPTFGFGLASIVASRRFQRLGDLAAGTVVVYAREVPEMVSGVPPPLESRAPGVGLAQDEARALVAFRSRVALWSEGRQIEMADHLQELSGARGRTGVGRLLAMAHWLQEPR